MKQLRRELFESLIPILSNNGSVNRTYTDHPPPRWKARSKQAMNRLMSCEE